MKSALQTLKLIKNYYQRQLKDHTLSIEDDVTTQSYLKISQNEIYENPLLHELIDKCLNIIKVKQHDNTVGTHLDLEEDPSNPIEPAATDEAEEGS